MWGRTLLLALIAAVGAAIAWAVSQPFLPYVPLSNTSIEAHFSLGTFYGWFNNLLLGILVCGPLAFFIAEPRTTPGKALLCGLVGAAIGGGLVCGADALSDYINIQAEHSSRSLGPLLVIDWHIMVAAAMAFSIAIACQPTPKRLLRALIATGIAAAGSFALRLFMTPFEAIVLVGRSMNSSPAEMAKMNSWAVYSPSELIQNVSMAIVMGLVLGFVEYYGRDAWLRLALGRNEGRDYSLERPINRIGSAEAAEIALKGDPAVMPFHAQVVQSHGSYSVEAMAGSVSVNGQPVQSATLQGGDIVSIGQATLMFMQKSRPNRVPQMIPAPVPPSPIPNQPVPVAETVERRGPSLEWAGGLTKSLAPGNNILGRDPASVVSLLSDQAVSRRHAEIDLTPLGAIVRDAGSRNGTLINGAPLTFDHKLADGDVIQIGSTKLTYRSH